MQTQKTRAAGLKRAFTLPAFGIILAFTFAGIPAPEAEAKSCAAAIGKGWGVTQSKARGRAAIFGRKKLVRKCAQRKNISLCYGLRAKFRGLRCKSAVKIFNGVPRFGKSCTLRAEACF